MVANASLLSNGYLANADNAAFGIQVVGDGPVYFAEAFHGYGESGLKALYKRWLAVLSILLMALITALGSVGFRFGPIEDEVRELAPPRRLYVEAMAAGVLRGHDPTQVVGPLQSELRRRLRRRTGLSATTDDVTLAAGAATTGLPGDLVAQALAVPSDDQHLLTVCQAAAHLIAIDQGNLPEPLTGAHP